MAGFISAGAAILIGSAVVAGAAIYSAQASADAQKKAARKQASAIKKAEEDAAARQVFGQAAEKNVEENADVLIGSEEDRKAKKRRSRVDLQGAPSSNIGGL